MTKYAVILETSKNKDEFRSGFGFYNKHINDLRHTGYEIMKIDVIDENQLVNQIKNLPQASIGLLWLRMHGSPKSMSASDSLEITVNNINNVFSCVPSLLAENSTIFLDSCSTGSLQNDFYNNMQFAFAKLTLKHLNVQIIAPSEKSHVSYFSILDNGKLLFEILPSPRSNQNVAVVLSQPTKVLLNETISSNIPLESIKDRLIKSLQLSITCPFLENFTGKKSDIIHTPSFAGFDLTRMLINIIRGEQNSVVALQLVKELIEIFHANPDYPRNLVFAGFFRDTTPLSSAIHYKRTEIALYLLKRGADLFRTVKGITLFDYAKQRDEENCILEDDNDELIIAARRKKENDHTKILAAIESHLQQNKPEETPPMSHPKFF